MPDDCEIQAVSEEIDPSKRGNGYRAPIIDAGNRAIEPDNREIVPAVAKLRLAVAQLAATPAQSRLTVAKFKTLAKSTLANAK